MRGRRQQQPYCLLACLKSQNARGDRFPFQAGGGALYSQVRHALILYSYHHRQRVISPSPLDFHHCQVELYNCMDVIFGNEHDQAPHFMWILTTIQVCFPPFLSSLPCLLLSCCLFFLFLQSFLSFCRM